MTKSQKIWLGILSFLPIVLIFLYIFVLFGTLIFGFTYMEHNHDEPEQLFLGGFALMFICIILAILLNLGLLVFYIIHAYKNKKFDSNLKLIWILVFLFGSGIGHIIYYFVEILPSGKETSD